MKRLILGVTALSLAFMPFEAEAGNKKTGQVITAAVAGLAAGALLVSASQAAAGQGHLVVQGGSLPHGFAGHAPHVGNGYYPHGQVGYNPRGVVRHHPHGVIIYPPHYAQPIVTHPHAHPHSKLRSKAAYHRHEIRKHKQALRRIHVQSQHLGY